MSDLLERLRKQPKRSISREAFELSIEAADELTALRTQVSELRADLEVARAALSPFSTGFHYWSELRILKPDFECKAQDFILTSDMERAFALLKDPNAQS